MTAPPRFPRIPLLESAPAASPDDLVIPHRARGEWFGREVIAEEKLDGANVAIWLEDGVPRCAGRGGVGAMDRAGQRGRLRAWLGERASDVLALLAPDEVLYGEWLFLEHGTRYDRLPDWLVALDIWHDGDGFRPVDVRDARCAAAGFAAVPVVHRGRLRSGQDLLALTQRSRFGSLPAEGLVLRREVDGRLADRVKWLRPDFVRTTDEEWARGRPTNALDPDRATS